MAGRKSIFITGAASGIGLATAKRYAKEGWFVGLADVNRAGLDAALAAIGKDNGTTIELDVRDRDAWKRALEQFSTAAGGRLDALMNNAGVASYGYLEEQSEEEVERQLDINIKGVINGARAGLSHLKSTQGATLINVSSCASIYGAPKLSVYCATKFAVRGLSEALDIEFARFGVKVVCIMPFFINTPILDVGAQGSNETMADSIKAGGTPVYSVEHCADEIWNAAQAGKLHAIVGSRGKQFHFLARLAPSLVRRQFRSADQAGKAPGS
jgi:NAD(P)-dependent dehydrogenase (short-subunit alcohol dehydrogenase family)